MGGFRFIFSNSEGAGAARRKSGFCFHNNLLIRTFLNYSAALNSGPAGSGLASDRDTNPGATQGRALRAAE
jgi:hypothetical protein